MYVARRKAYYIYYNSFRSSVVYRCVYPYVITISVILLCQMTFAAYYYYLTLLFDFSAVNYVAVLCAPVTVTSMLGETYAHLPEVEKQTEATIRRQVKAERSYYFGQ